MLLYCQVQWRGNGINIYIRCLDRYLCNQLGAPDHISQGNYPIPMIHNCFSFGRLG